MEKANEVNTGPQGGEAAARAGDLRGVLPRAFILGAVAGVVAYGPGGVRAALAALAGALAAGLYVATYLGSHLAAIGQRTRVFDPKIVRSAALRMSLTALGAGGALMAGRMALLAYLVSFAAAFLLLLLFEIPSARRTLQRLSR